MSTETRTTHWVSWSMLACGGAVGLTLYGGYSHAHQKECVTEISAKSICREAHYVLPDSPEKKHRGPPRNQITRVASSTATEGQWAYVAEAKDLDGRIMTWRIVG
jgi:hypothetical protein